MRGGLTNVFNDMPKKPPSKQQLYILQDSVIPVAVQYNTDKTLSDLSQRISLGIKKDRNGDEINPTVPPKYITYEMLYNECLGDVQVPRITKEEKDTLKATFIKKTEYSHYNKSIGAKILLNDKLYELERVKWWCDWYKIMKGSGTAAAAASSSSSLRKAKTVGVREQHREARIQELYSILIPIRNTLLSSMRKNKAYTAADVIKWTAILISNDDYKKINAANEKTQTGGADDLFIKARDKLIKDINKIKNNRAGGIIILRDDILKMAEKCLQMRNVKSATTVNKKSRKKKTYMRYDEKLDYIQELVKDRLVIAAVYAKQQQLTAMVQFNPQAVVATGKQLDELSRRANLDALRLRAKTNADPRRHKQLKEVQAKQGRDRKDLQLQTRIRDAQEQARQAQEEEIRQARQAQEEEIRQAQAQAAQAARAEREEAERLERRYYRDLGRQRPRFNTTLGDRYVKPQGQPFRQQQGQRQQQRQQQGQRNPDFSFFEEELRKTWSQAEQADAERAAPAPQSPPRAATRAVPVQAPAPVAQPFVATQDDSNLGSLETWDAISKTRIKWDNISGIHGLLGSNNNNTVASVMLFLYLRDNKNIQPLLGNETIDTLTARFKRAVFNTNPSIRPIGDEFFKIKDSQSNVYSISRMILLRQRLNRIFFFLARDRNSSSYNGFKRSRGDGYNFANYIGITDQDFEVIIKNKADYTKSVSLGAGNAVSMFSGEAPSEQTVNVVIPITLYKIYRKVLLKSHPDKGGSDGEIKRSQLMFENFLKWIKSYNPTKTENETHFYNVEHLEVLWDKYNEGKWDKYNEDNDFTMKWFLD